MTSPVQLSAEPSISEHCSKKTIHSPQAPSQPQKSSRSDTPCNKEFDSDVKKESSEHLNSSSLEVRPKTPSESATKRVISPSKDDPNVPIPCDSIDNESLSNLQIERDDTTIVGSTRIKASRQQTTKDASAQPNSNPSDPPVALPKREPQSRIKDEHVGIETLAATAASVSSLASKPTKVAMRSARVSTGPSSAPIADDDVVFVDGQAFNGRGYPVCGVANQRGKRCGRIGTCPFHSGIRTKTKATNEPSASISKSPAKRPRSSVPSTKPSPAFDPMVGVEGTAVPTSGVTNDVPSATPTNGKRGRGANATKREVAIPPRKSRFKRSWTPDEHLLFLTAMRRHGRGKWKEIATDVKTRTANQCQSHAQKYFLRQAKSDSERKKKSIHDVTDVQVSMEDMTSLPGIQQPPAPSVPSPSSKPVVLFPRRSQAVPLAPGPAPPRPSIVLGTDGTTLLHRVAPNSTPSSALLTCAGRGTTVTTVATQALSTVPVVFPVSNISNMQYTPLVQSFLTPGNASSAAVIPPPPPAKLRVTVHVNGKLRGGMALMLPDSLDQFFEQAKSKLNFSGCFCRVFTRSGGEITCLDEMCQDDTLWLSSGEDFLTPR